MEEAFKELYYPPEIEERVRLMVKEMEAFVGKFQLLAHIAEDKKEDQYFANCFILFKLAELQEKVEQIRRDLQQQYFYT